MRLQAEIGPLQPRLQHLCAVVARIVQEDADARRFRIVRLDFQEQPKSRLAVDLFALDAGERISSRLKAPQGSGTGARTSPSGSGGAFREPAVRY